MDGEKDKKWTWFGVVALIVCAAFSFTVAFHFVLAGTPGVLASVAGLLVFLACIYTLNRL